MTALTWAGYTCSIAFEAMAVALTAVWTVRALARWHRRRRGDREFAARLGATIRAIRADFDDWERDLAAERSGP
jgi:asparagine synthetase A